MPLPFPWPRLVELDATYALLIKQADPVGVIVGFLTLYFGVAAYKCSKVALEKIYPNKFT